ncbi:MAG TPA: cupin, partial [Arthrobacter bacterium]|nr:cupin [Arthrobacter sp.]
MSVNAENLTHASVAAGQVVPEPTPEEAAALEKLYEDFESENLIPLWTQIGDLMPMVPSPKAVPHVWRWDDLYPLAARAGDLVPVGRGGERRAIALANPGLAGTPYATPTLWAAIQYL